MAIPVFVGYETVNGEARMEAHPALKQTDAEIAASVMPVNFAYPPYDLRRYGGIGDDATDNSVAIANWIAATPAGGKAVLPSDGIYRYSTGFTRSTSIAIVGDTTQGAAGSRLKYTGTGVAMTFSGGGSMNGLRFENFALEGNASAQTGISISNSYNGIQFDHIMIEAFSKVVGGTYPGTCLYIEDAFDISMSGCQLRQSNNGIVAGLATVPVFAVVNAVWIRGSEFTGITNIGISVLSGVGWNILGCDFSGLATNAIGVDLAGNLTAGTNRALKGCVIDTCYFEFALTTTGNIAVRIGSGATIGVSSIQNNVVRNCYLAVQGDQISVDYCRGAVIENNHHGALGGGAATVRVSANAVDTRIVMVPRTGIVDAGTNTIYDTQDLRSLVEVANNYTSPAKSGFLARPSGTINNVVGNAGTVYTLICDSEIKDTQAEYNNATGVFTAQKTAGYSFAAAVTVTSAGGMTSAQLRLVTSNRTYDLALLGAVATAGGAFTISGSIPYADMDAADTASITLEVSGVGANTADITTGSYFSGALAG